MAEDRRTRRLRELPDDIGLSIDMLDVDRLREWARLIQDNGADISYWASYHHVVFKLQALATALEKAVRDIGELRAAVLDTEGDRPEPTSATSTLRGAADSAFAFLDSIEWTDHTSAEEAENVKQMLQDAIAVTEGEP